MKIIGLDIGEKRVGVAMADTTVKIAYPHSTIIADGTELDQLKKLMSDENTNLVVVGLPRNSQGIETAQSKIVRLFATQLQSRGARIKFQDESLTSVIAERRLKARKKPYKKEDIDSEAAAIILQDFIENFRPGEQKKQTFAHRAAVEEGLLAPTSSRTAATAPRKDGRARERAPGGKRSGFSPSYIIQGLIVILFVFLSIATIWFFSGTTSVANIPLRQPFKITTGESTQEIAENLKDAGLIKDPLVFTVAAYLTRASIPAKVHFISPSENIWQILDQLTGKQT